MRFQTIPPHLNGLPIPPPGIFHLVSLLFKSRDVSVPDKLSKLVVISRLSSFLFGDSFGFGRDENSWWAIELNYHHFMTNQLFSRDDFWLPFIGLHASLWRSPPLRSRQRWQIGLGKRRSPQRRGSVSTRMSPTLATKWWLRFITPCQKVAVKNYHYPANSAIPWLLPIDDALDWWCFEYFADIRWAMTHVPSPGLLNFISNGPVLIFIERLVNALQKEASLVACRHFYHFWAYTINALMDCRDDMYCRTFKKMAACYA